MIIRMVRNLTSFFVILLIFIVAYAVASHAILDPNTEISFNVLRIIFRRPYWNIYGDLMLDEIEGTNDCTNIMELYRNGTQPRCPTESGKYVVPMLMGMYMLMCNILLLNLLISIFSNTYQMVHENAVKHWHLQRYRQIKDYIHRPMYFPFISFIGDIFQIIVFLKEYLRRCKPENKTSRQNVNLQPCSEEKLRRDKERDEVRKWERNIAQVFFNSKKADLKGIDHSVKANTLRLDQLDSKIDALEEQQHVLTTTMENDTYQKLDQLVSKIDAFEEKLDKETATIVDRLYRGQTEIEKKLQWIVDTLKEYKPGAEQASPGKTGERVEG